jgi:hypothetical protein
MKKKLLEVMFFYCQIIGKYNAIATLLGTLILKMVTNQQHITYIYTRNDIFLYCDTVSI